MAAVARLGLGSPAGRAHSSGAASVATRSDEPGEPRSRRRAGPSSALLTEPSVTDWSASWPRLVSGSRRSLRSERITQLRRFASDPVQRCDFRRRRRSASTGRRRWRRLWPSSGTRLTGDYAVDEFGFDPEFTTKIFLPLLRPLAQSWFRVEVRGAENLPADGSALLVSNHAGTLPLDGMILHSWSTTRSAGMSGCSVRI